MKLLALRSTCQLRSQFSDLGVEEGLTPKNERLTKLVNPLTRQTPQAMGAGYFVQYSFGGGGIDGASENLTGCGRGDRTDKVTGLE